MPVTGQFFLRDYTSENGLWRLHFENPAPGPGMPTDYYMDIPESELPANINQTQLASALKQRLSWTLNQTFAPLNQFITAGAPVTLP
jgi:hypothetical protein